MSENVVASRLCWTSKPVSLVVVSVQRSWIALPETAVAVSPVGAAIVAPAIAGANTTAATRGHAALNALPPATANRSYGPAMSSSTPPHRHHAQVAAGSLS